MHIEEKQLKSFILDSGLVSGRDAAEAEEEAQTEGFSIGEVLVSKGKLSEDDLRRAQAYLLGIPFVDLRTQKIESEALSLIPEPVARNHNVVAFKKDGSRLFVALLHMKDLDALDVIRKKTGLKLLPRLTDSASIKHALLQYQKTLRAEFGDFVRRETEAFKALSGKPPSGGDAESVRKLAQSEPAVRMLDSLLRHALAQNASDVHIEPFEQELVVRYRIGGVLRDSILLPKDAQMPIIGRIKTLANLRLDQTDLPQEGGFKAEGGGEKASFQTLVMPTVHGEKAVLRPVAESAAAMTPQGLGLHGQALERIHDAVGSQGGLVIVGGPTRSGKTAALYAFVEMANSPDKSISTIEEAIERRIPRVGQTLVRPSIGLSFSSALRTALRQDADVVMVGDIRDVETASLAAHAAIAGKLILAGLHAGSAAGVVSRLMEMKADPITLSSALSVIVSRRLVRRLADSTHRRPLKKTELAALGKAVDLDRVLSALREERIIHMKDGWDKVLFGFASSDNPAASYRGHVGVHEVMRISPALRSLIAKKALASEIRTLAKKEGMMTLLEDAVIQAARGLTTIEEAIRVVSE